uniref:Ubiquitin-like domain-containing protein n=1 Tax=Romanomermis culicivorax TaxID=13658 RepID=A0A915L3C5_ROMCU
MLLIQTISRLTGNLERILVKALKKMSLIQANGSQKFPLTLYNENDSEDQKQQTTSASEETESWTLLNVKKEIAKTINVDPKYQRIIHKGSILALHAELSFQELYSEYLLHFIGKTLFGDEKYIKSFNLKSGDKVMVLTGAKPNEFTEEDKKLNEFETFIENKLKCRINDLATRVDGIEKGFICHDMISGAFKEVDKLEKHLAEDCMRTLESLDGLGIGQEPDNNCRVRRKALVKSVQ